MADLYDTGSSRTYGFTVVSYGKYTSEAAEIARRVARLRQSPKRLRASWTGPTADEPAVLASTLVTASGLTVAGGPTAAVAPRVAELPGGSRGPVYQRARRDAAGNDAESGPSRLRGFGPAAMRTRPISQSMAPGGESGNHGLWSVTSDMLLKRRLVGNRSPCTARGVNRALGGRQSEVYSRCYGHPWCEKFAKDAVGPNWFGDDPRGRSARAPWLVST